MQIVKAILNTLALGNCQNGDSAFLCLFGAYCYIYSYEYIYQISSSSYCSVCLSESRVTLYFIVIQTVYIVKLALRKTYSPPFYSAKLCFFFKYVVYIHSNISFALARSRSGRREIGHEWECVCLVSRFLYFSYYCNKQVDLNVFFRLVPCITLPLFTLWLMLMDHALVR